MNPGWKRSALTIVACIALAVIIFALGAKVSSSSAVDRSTQQVQKLTTVVEKLQVAQDQRTCQAQADSTAFAVVLHSLADNFSTPPYPDPARITAVDKMNATADFFDNAAKKPTVCKTLKDVTP